jgi:feruloyl esterase
VTITSAENVAAGPFVVPDASGNALAPAAQPIPAHCRVKWVLKPSSDSRINAELWLPSAEFMAVGNVGFGGAISINGYGDMQVALRRGYATAGNDTGHTEAEGPGGRFGLGHPEKDRRLLARAMHEMTVSAQYNGTGSMKDAANWSCVAP